MKFSDGDDGLIRGGVIMAPAVAALLPIGAVEFDRA
jgi:hypothetical protein